MSARAICDCGWQADYVTASRALAYAARHTCKATPEPPLEPLRRRRAEHGTESGYYRHLRSWRTTPCDDCREAHALGERVRHMQRHPAARPAPTVPAARQHVPRLPRPMPQVRLLHPSQLPPMADWADQALCAQVDPEIFFPAKGGGVREALSVCANCPVADLCLEMCIAYERTVLQLPSGVWGGSTAAERKGWLRDLPGLCLDCPAERELNEWYCRGCATRHQVENQARSAALLTTRDWFAVA